MIQLLLARYGIEIGLIVLVLVGAQAAGVPVYSTVVDLLAGFGPDWLPL